MVFQRMAEQRLLLLFKLTEASTWLNSMQGRSLR